MNTSVLRGRPLARGVAATVAGACSALLVAACASSSPPGGQVGTGPARNATPSAAAAVTVARVATAAPGSGRALARGTPALAAPGAWLWSRRYNGPGNGYDQPAGMAVSPDGTAVFITGSAATTSGADYATVAYRAGSGATLWVRNLTGSATAIATSPTGGKVFVTGNTTGPAIGTIAYDAKTGTRLWVSRVNDSTATSLAVSPDGRRVFAAGTSGGGADYITVAYDAATGARLWVRHYPGGGGSCGARAVAVSPGGKTVFVTGNGFGPAADDYATIAYDTASGKQLWVSRYDGPAHGDDYAFAVAASPDGTTVFVSGDSIPGGAGDNDFATVAYNAATGAQLWVQRYNGPGNSDDQVHAMAVSPDGKAVFVTGTGGRAGKANAYTTIAYHTATGAQIWLRRYSAMANLPGSVAYSMAVSPSGRTLFVTGDSPGPNSEGDFATLAYRAATGAQLWVKRSNGPANGAAGGLSVAVSPTAKQVFVTGFSQGLTISSHDYYTIAYRR